MVADILVVGLWGRSPADDLEPMLAGRTLIARSRQSAERLLRGNWAIGHDYDAILDQESLAGIEERIADDIVGRLAGGPIAYLVPGPGWVGDATVTALMRRIRLALVPGVAGRLLPPHTQMTDALVLAQAQVHAPFDRGREPLDATSPTLVLNWYGERITSLAALRLSTTYGIDGLPKADRTGTILIPARDPLDSPPSFAALEYITARLRRPDGCPWDREQTHESMLDDFASEVTEYAEAVQSGDWPHAAEELGDVLLNVLMQAQIGTESGHFTMADVLTSITAKLVRRHPHVFAGVDAQTPQDVLAVWNSVKQQERASSPNSSSKE